MKTEPDGDRLYLDRILELADVIVDSLREWTEEGFAKDRTMADATAFRLSAIGELTRKLSSSFKLRHPEIAWEAIYRMRNIIVHDYYRVDHKTVWKVARNSLDALIAVCRAELDRLP